MSISKNTILVWSVVILMAANVVLMIFIFTSHNKQRPPGGTPADYLTKELALNNDQQKKLLSLARDHHRQAEDIKENIKEARHKLFELLKHPENDSAGNAAADSVAAGLKKLDLLTFEHFKEVRAMLTPAQQNKFDDIIEDVLRMIAAPQGPPPGNRRMPPTDDHMPPPGQ
jgi:Spy/CpxP family protein refolding chaperone